MVLVMIGIGMVPTLLLVILSGGWKDLPFSHSRPIVGQKPPDAGLTWATHTTATKTPELPRFEHTCRRSAEPRNAPEHEKIGEADIEPEAKRPAEEPHRVTGDERLLAKYGAEVYKDSGFTYQQLYDAADELQRSAVRDLIYNKIGFHPGCWRYQQVTQMHVSILVRKLKNK